MTRVMSTAVERTAPVMVRLPTVRYRTHSTAEVSPLRVLVYSGHREQDAVAFEYLTLVGEEIDGISRLSSSM